MELILASGSPRRAELLKQMGLTFSVQPSEIEEGKPQKPWNSWVQELSAAKARALDRSEGQIIIAADTIVVHGNRVLGKPTSAEEAVEMLRCLSGSVHEVLTGICVLGSILNSERTAELKDVEVTRVFFRQLTKKEILSYAATGEPLDKAGAYGIQGLGGLLVERIEGCYYNVVGLPLVKTMSLLRKFGIEVLGEDAG